MPASNFRKVHPLTINWEAVDRLMVEADIPHDFALAIAGHTSPSTIHRARRGAASWSAISAIARAFPDASLDELLARHEQLEPVAA